MRIKSSWEGDDAVCTWEPQPYHSGGSKDIVYGGIIASLIDCHSANLAIAHAYKKDGRPIGSHPRIAYVTANLNVAYINPTPIGSVLHLRAKVIKSEGRKTWVSCTLSAEGQVRAMGEVLAIRVQREDE